MWILRQTTFLMLTTACNASHFVITACSYSKYGWNAEEYILYRLGMSVDTLAEHVRGGGMLSNTAESHIWGRDCAAY